MGKMPYGNRILLKNIAEEWSLVIDQEIEDTMLVWELKRHRVRSAVLRGDGGFQVQPLERREHAEFELQLIVLRNGERDVLVPRILR